VASARDGAGRLVVVRRPAGIDKSQLLANAISLADETGLVALSARDTELERELGFGVTLQLSERLVEDLDPVAKTRLLSVAAGLASSLLSGRAPPADDSFAVIHVALRACGLIEGGDRGLELLQHAARALRGSDARLERARALADLGAALRRAGRRSGCREPLRQALVIAPRGGATALAASLEEELAASGARPRGRAGSAREALTPSERRVAVPG
jgi:hypothetical protein